jgi:hypothetical protein
VEHPLGEDECPLAGTGNTSGVFGNIHKPSLST